MKARCTTALLILPFLLLAGCQALAAITKVGADINQSVTQTVMGPQAADDEVLPRLPRHGGRGDPGQGHMHLDR